MKRLNTALLSLLLLMSVLLSACGALPQSGGSSATLDNIPAYSGQAYVELNGNQPTFSEDELVTESFETYSSLDSLGRCGVAYANVGLDTMPTEERGSIGQVKPSGWQTVKYDCVDGKYLYNRCHLIGYQLTAENANKENLITGTRYLNVEGMLPFENLVADYVKETENHVLYRVTPIFEGDNLVASGVQMEAMSVEDKGRVCASMSTATTSSPAWPLTTPPATAGWKGMRPLAAEATAVRRRRRPPAAALPRQSRNRSMF